QVQLYQSWAELVRPEATIKMSCKHSHEKSLEWIRNINPYHGVTNYNEKFKGKATLTVDKSSSTACMGLSRLTPEDSAIYYCARHSVATTS
uniref:Immunoglobulin V-set domain-containing protein n=1 Tax=Rattus norvegicus TaxID=10116 RepID=A0ABK0LHE3_RAT